MLNGARTAAGWTLILWDIENVPVPEQLRDPSGIKQLKDLLKDRFAKTRSLQLHCIKLACRWPDCRSPYATLLGWLTTLGDVEALGYQWQGQKDKIHNADRLLKQAADRFMHMLELHGGPEHLVVFITSDQDFCEKIQELQRRNFKVVVLYHGPSASQKPVSITSVADESHDWLTFLKRELGFSHLTLAPYDPTAYHGASQGYNSGMTPPPPSATRQPSQESRTPSKAGSRPSSAGAASPHMQRAPSQASHKRQDIMCIKVAREQDFQDQIGANQWFDMMDPVKVAQFWVHNKATVGEFKRTLANKWGTAVKSQRIWPWQRRQNLSVRLSSPVDSSLDGQRLADVTVRSLPGCELQRETCWRAESVSTAVISHTNMTGKPRETYNTSLRQLCQTSALQSVRWVQALLECPYLILVSSCDDCSENMRGQCNYNNLKAVISASFVVNSTGMQYLAHKRLQLDWGLHA